LQTYTNPRTNQSFAKEPQFINPSADC